MLRWNTIRSLKIQSNSLLPSLLPTRSRSASTPLFNPSHVTRGSSSSPFTPITTSKTLGGFGPHGSYLHTALDDSGVEVLVFSKASK
jgi:hypothetical protein